MRLSQLADASRELNVAFPLLAQVAQIRKTWHFDDSLPEQVAALNLLVGNGLMVVCSAIAALGRRNVRLALFALVLPAYWVLHSLAAWRALGQLVTRPSYWEKTPHGLSRQRAPG